MKLKDATRSLGSVGILLPLILIFLIAAGSTYACPGTRVVYRTRTVSRVAPMGTTLITYGGQPCTETAYVARPTRYIAVRGNSYYSSGPRHVSVRNYDSYVPARRARYVAVRSDDVDYAPSRYVVVRRQPAYVEMPTRYVAVRTYAPQTRYVAVRSSDIDTDDVDYDYSPHYVRRQPVCQTRYIAVRHMDSDYDDDDYVAPARYVAVRKSNSACACGVSSLNDVETTAPRHVVVKTDYIAGTQDVIVPRPSFDDTAYLAVPSGRLTTARYINDDDSPYWDDANATFAPARFGASPRVRKISYVPANYDSDYDDEAIPDTDDASYVAANDVGDACLSRVAVQAPMEMNTRTVSYVPVDDVDYDASLSGSQPTYIVSKSAAPAIRYVPLADEDSDVDATYVAAGDVGASCSCPIAAQNPVALRTFEDDLGYHTVTAITADNMTALNTVPVSYSSTKDVNYVPADTTDLTTADYIPADEMDVDNDSDGPAQSVSYADTADTDAVVQPSSETAFVTDDTEVTEPEPIAVDPAAVVEEPDMSAEMTATQAVANDAGYRDGLADGQNAALNGEENRPGDMENFQAATNGYDDTLGDANTYGVAYRSAYLQGFSSGYNSEIGP